MLAWPIQLDIIEEEEKENNNTEKAAFTGGMSNEFLFAFINKIIFN